MNWKLTDVQSIELCKTISNIILEYESKKPVLVGIDGIDAAGKTYFADHLANYIRTKTGREIIRASIDGFHNSRKKRIRQGENSAIGYYEDSFDYKKLKEFLLDPLSNNTILEYHTRVFDYRKDRSVDEPPKKTSRDSILIFDGIFLLRSELISYWNISIFLKITFTEALKRAFKRDKNDFENKDILLQKYTERYFPAQQMYLKQSKPEVKANIVIGNNDFKNPEIIRTSFTKCLDMNNI